MSEYDANQAPVLAQVAQQGSTFGAILLSGDDHVSIASDPSLTTALQDEYTLELWFKVNQFVGSYMPLVQKLDDATFDLGLGLWVSATGTLFFGTNSVANGATSFETAAGLVKLGAWHHFAVSVDRVSGHMDLYLDGQAVGTKDVPAGSQTSVNTAPLFFGFSPLFGGSFYPPFRGEIDEVRLWSAARSADEIRDERAAQLSGLEDDLVGYWRFNELGGNTALDSSAAGNDGVLVGTMGRTLPPVHLAVFDEPGDDVLLDAVSNVPGLGLTIVGTDLFITPPAGFSGTATITVTAYDGIVGSWIANGRTASMTFDISFGDNAIYGTKWNDLDADGVRDADEPALEGVQVFIDEDGDGELDSGEATTWTDTNGEYALRGVHGEPDEAAVLTAPLATTASGGLAFATFVTGGGTLRISTEARFDFYLDGSDAAVTVIVQRARHAGQYDPRPAPRRCAGQPCRGGPGRRRRCRPCRYPVAVHSLRARAATYAPSGRRSVDPRGVSPRRFNRL
jgi:hypothetical protein